MTLRRTSSTLLAGLRGVNGHVVNQGATIGTAAVCQTCRKIADEEQIVFGADAGQFVHVLARCHGAEQVHRIDLGTDNFDSPEDRGDQITQHLRNIVWFRPETYADRELRMAASVPAYDGDIQPSGKLYSTAGVVLASERAKDAS